jgi:hypothetical protein
MTSMRKATTAVAIVFAVACGVSQWTAASWERSVRLDLLLRGYPAAQLEDPLLHPDQLGTHAVTAAFIRAGTTCLGWVGRAGDVHLVATAGGRRPNWDWPMQFYLVPCKVLTGLIALIFAILSLPHVVLWGHRSTAAGFPVRMANDPTARRP